ncbi:hypothetical protein [Bacteroides pyogenes]|uniref:hypothetical protein n=1 Tax=Bacteroides pyogenes TaxID=310300 RepID=UPI001BA60EC6|nr:hypothetical protein [Bacteroides pyogenes]MBR8725530.1 hypothetical protein [Bacteroides pyogenes]MBR8737689.1 hypothetical protein [Bacteroides pyogenes]MBR8753265.1 hypothetical protein [Bacteroides pyogenes]MBR8794687.1 hypothetical protein [Bacteroides pyogenes]
MSLTIKRKKDNRVVKCILHRVADIPGGVTISVANLGGSALLEGTPLGVGTDGLFVVCKTAQVITKAEANAVAYEVAKGHHFKVGDRFATDACDGQPITAIDKTDPAKDVITVGTTLGAVVKPGTCAFESSGANKTLKNTPVAIAGSNHDVENGDNLFTDAWVIGVVRKSNAPILNDTAEKALKGIVYV